MKPMIVAAAGVMMSASISAADSHASGDAAAGEKVFGKCKACHAIVDADGQEIVKGGRTGPNLYGVYQRQAGAEADFGRKYGDSLVEAGEKGLTWDEAHFTAFVADTRGFLQDYLDSKNAKSKMSFKLRKEEDAKDVWAYLVSVGPEPAE